MQGPCEQLCVMHDAYPQRHLPYAWAAAPSLFRASLPSSQAGIRVVWHALLPGACERLACSFLLCFPQCRPADGHEQHGGQVLPTRAVYRVPAQHPRKPVPTGKPQVVGHKVEHPLLCRSASEAGGREQVRHPPPTLAHTRTVLYSTYCAVVQMSRPCATGAVRGA